MNKTIVYRTRFNQKIHPNRKEFYYGVHSRGDNSYLGSGKIVKDFFKSFGRNAFIRDTIAEFDNEDDAYKLEELIVDQRMLDNPFCLNVALGGKTPTRAMKGKKQSEEQKKAVSIAKKAYWEDYYMKHGMPVKWERGVRNKGEMNGMYGRSDDNPAARQCTDGQKVFPTIKRMAEYHNIGYSAANARIRRGYKQWKYVRKEEDGLC